MHGTWRDHSPQTKISRLNPDNTCYNAHNRTSGPFKSGLEREVVLISR